MNIAEIRQKYPQYSDLSDTQLADALHSKYYSDMPKGDFYAKIGFGIGVQPQAEFEAGVPQPVQIAQAPNAVVPGLGEITTGMQAAPDSIWEGSTPGADAFPIEQPEQIPSWRLPSPVADPSHVSAVQESLPVLGGMAGSLMGGPQAGLVVSSALGGLGTAGGELVRQPFAGEPLSFEKAGKKGAMAFGAGLVGGSFFRGLLGRGVEDDLGQSALKFAEAKGAPMPPGTLQGRAIAQAARAPALGDLYVAQQAGKVSQVVDDEIAKYSGVGSVDDMVTAAKDMIGNKLDARSGYEGILNAVGGNTKIPLTNTTDAIRRALPQIKQTGADDLYAMVKDAGSQMESEKYFGRVLSMPFDRLNGFMTKVFQKTETANMAVADDIVNAMKADIQSAVVNNPQLAMKLQEAGGDVFKMFADANKQMRFVKAFLKEAPEVRGMLKGGTPNQFLTKFSQSPKVRELVKALDPEAHDQISKAWIAANLERLKAGNNMQGFYKFAVDNKSTIKSMFGEEQAEALQNFAAYLKVTGGFLKDADLMAQTRAMPVIAGRLWTEAKLMTPAGAAAAEAGSLGAIHSLMNPNGVLFKVFTKGLTDSELAAAANPAGNLMDFDRISQFFTGTPAAQ